jgi:hypothetical protein
VKENIQAAQEKQKQTYDRKHSGPSLFSVGAKVLKKDFLRKKRKGGKMDPQWLGPYEIAADLGKGFYALSDVTNGDIAIKRVNGAHLKAYNSNTPSSHASSIYF